MHAVAQRFILAAACYTAADDGLRQEIAWPGDCTADRG
jgi:hypothetical protein